MKFLTELLAYAKKKTNINNVYVNGGFFNVKCIQVLQKHKVKWLMPAIQNTVIKKLLKKYGAPKILDYLMDRKNFD